MQLLSSDGNYFWHNLVAYCGILRRLLRIKMIGTLGGIFLANFVILQKKCLCKRSCFIFFSFSPKNWQREIIMARTCSMSLWWGKYGKRHKSQYANRLITFFSIFFIFNKKIWKFYSVALNLFFLSNSQFKMTTDVISCPFIVLG